MSRYKLSAIVRPLLAWYGKGHRSLPWRSSPTAYHVWISEIMLQQTRVEAVKPYYTRFIERYPDVYALADANEEELMKLWEGLGYYSRARNLKKAAQKVVDTYQGVLPDSVNELKTLPGIGGYTAGAIASIAYGKPEPAVDGNVFRVVTRLLALADDISKPATKRNLEELLRDVYPAGQSSEFTQALMELGATVCLPNGEPQCHSCPLRPYCISHQDGTMLNYPVKPKKKGRRIEQRTVFLLVYGSRVILQKRAGKGVLAGLWEFPGAEGHLNVETARDCVRSWGFSAGEIRDWGEARHIFTHIEWQMKCYLVFVEGECPSGYELADSGELRDQYALPHAFKSPLKTLLIWMEELEEKKQ